MYYKRSVFCVALSISHIAREQADFIEAQLDDVGRQLHPSSAKDSECIRRAIFSVRNQSIIFQQFNNASATLYTQVQDVQVAQVTVFFYEHKINCSCKSTGWCRHKVAVLLSLYQHLHSVQQWAGEWRSQQAVQLHTLADARSPESWQRLIVEVANHVLHDKRRLDGYNMVYARNEIMSQLKKHMPFEREWQPLYQVFMEIGVMQKIWQFLQQQITEVNAFESNAFMYLTNEWLDDITVSAEKLQRAPQLFATEPFYQAIRQNIRDFILFENTHFPQRLHAYATIWLMLFTTKALREDELAILQKAAKNPSPQLADDVDFYALEALLYMLIENETLLKANCDAITKNRVATLFLLAKFAHEHATWAKPFLLRATLPHLQYYIHHELAAYARKEFIQEAHYLFNTVALSHEEEELLFGAFGKFGLQPYSLYLVEQQRFGDWAALQLLHRVSPQEAERHGLKTLLQQAPAETLPLYHSFAIAELQGKSRPHYKRAVRLWKSMKSAAKKADKLPFFHSYMEGIRKQFKRLRALQEEIEKGNLLL